jgi:hypothetical protein
MALPGLAWVEIEPSTVEVIASRSFAVSETARHARRKPRGKFLHTGMSGSDNRSGAARSFLVLVVKRQCFCTPQARPRYGLRMLRLQVYTMPFDAGSSDSRSMATADPSKD